MQRDAKNCVKLASFSCISGPAYCPVCITFSATTQKLTRNIIYFMLCTSKMQGEAQNSQSERFWVLCNPNGGHQPRWAWSTKLFKVWALQAQIDFEFAYCIHNGSVLILVFKKTRDKKDKNHRITLKTHKRQSKLSQLRRDGKKHFALPNIWLSD